MISAASLQGSYEAGFTPTAMGIEELQAEKKRWLQPLSFEPNAMQLAAASSRRLQPGITSSPAGVSAFSQPLGMSASTAQSTSVSGNRMAASDAARQAIELAEGAAKGLNPAGASEFYKALETALPGYRGVVNQMQANTMSALRGELPPDVVNMIRMTSGEQRQQGALEGTARNLGLTSLQRSDQGFKMGEELVGMAKNFLTAPTYDVFSGYERAFQQIFGAGAMTPSQASGIGAQQYGLGMQAAGLAEQAREFDATQAWERELSAVNMAYTRSRDSIEANLSAQMVEQARASRTIDRNAYQAMTGRTTGPGAAPIAALPPMASVAEVSAKSVPVGGTPKARFSSPFEALGEEQDIFAKYKPGYSEEG